MTLVSRLRRRVAYARFAATQAITKAWIRQIGSRIGTHHDDQTGLIYQNVFGYKVFIRSKRDYLAPNLVTWLCSGIYFKHYLPSNHDVVVDIGAGYGHEAFYLLSRSAGVKYFGIEVQPSIYEHLCNSFREVSSQCKAICFAVSKHEDSLFLSSMGRYTKASTTEKGYIEVPAIQWDLLLARYGIGQIDLLKVNIEGGERMLLPSIGDMRTVRRVIISAHDFRADNGEGEYFRTYEFVKTYLQDQGYRLRSIDEHNGWLRNWIYADREP